MGTATGSGFIAQRSCNRGNPVVWPDLVRSAARRAVVSVVVSAACATAACSEGSSASSSSRGVAPPDTAGAVKAVEVPMPPPLPLGKASLDEFGYRRGPGRDAYDRAVKAEKLAKGDADWQTVIDACREALAADPGNLDAAWLMAAAHARKGEHDRILAPLSLAVAGDWGKWGERSLTLPLFEAFLASPHGEVWRALAEDYRAGFGEAARRAVIVLGRQAPRGDDLDRRTEVHGWDPGTGRWLRLSRTGGTVIAALPGPEGSGLVAYVAYRELNRPGERSGALERPRVAVIDRASGRVSREMAFDDVDELRLGWKAKPGDDPDVVVVIDGGHDEGAWLVDWKRGHKKKPPASQKLSPGKDALIVARGQVRRKRLAAGVTADWDDDGLASAIRLDATRKTVTPPAGLVVDGHGLVWSPDRARLALVALPDDGDCAAEATLFAVDAGTGKLRELGKSAAPAPIWVDDARLAYTAGDRVRVVEVASARVERELTSEGGVATAIVDRACADAAVEEEALFATPGGDEIEEPIDDQ